MDDPNASKVVGQIEIMGAPGQVEGPKPMLGSWLVAVPATSERQETARDFIDFLTSPDMQKRLALEVGAPSPPRPVSVVFRTAQIESPSFGDHRRSVPSRALVPRLRRNGIERLVEQPHLALGQALHFESRFPAVTGLNRPGRCDVVRGRPVAGVPRGCQTCEEYRNRSVRAAPSLRLGSRPRGGDGWSSHRASAPVVRSSHVCAMDKGMLTLFSSARAGVVYAPRKRLAARRSSMHLRYFQARPRKLNNPPS